jgi:hypothetical protein
VTKGKPRQATDEPMPVRHWTPAPREREVQPRREVPAPAAPVPEREKVPAGT